MSFLQRSMLRGLSGLLLVISPLMLTAAFTAESPLASELDRTRRANQAMGNLVNAKLALERFNLDQIRSLRQQGHASWLELSRQKVLVDCLEKQRDSLEKFEQFVTRLEQPVNRASMQRTSVAPSRETITPIKVYLPGSMRLAGWIETDAAAEQTIRNQPWLISTSSGAEDQNKMIQMAQARLAQAEQRCQDFAIAAAAPAAWSQRAELQRDLAQAELDLLQLQQDVAPVPSVQAAQNVPTVFPHDNQEANLVRAELLRSFPAMVTADSQTDLYQATYRVAWAEARAIGSVQAAEVELITHKLRTQAVARLHADGHATDAALKSSRKLFEQAAARLEQQRKRIAGLRETWREMETPHGFTMTEIASENPASNRLNRRWPTAVLSDPARLRHAVDLRRKYFYLDGQRAASIVRLEMQKQLLQKLKDARVQTAEAKRKDGRIAALAVLRASLAEGDQHQIDSAHRKTRLLEARVRDLGEKMFILSLEEDRFILQCIQQNRATERQLSTLAVHSAADSTDIQTRPASFHVTRSIIPGPGSYLECSTPGEWNGELIFVCDSEPEYFNFAFDSREGSPLIHSTRFPAGVSLPKQRFGTANYQSQYRVRSISPPSGVASKPAATSWSETPNRYGSWSHHSIYPFGVLRPDLRDRLPPGYPPWYLPGSPTNLQK